MIQELYPYKLDNQYRNAVPKAGDRIISIRDHRMLVKEQEDGMIDFPKVEELGVGSQEHNIFVNVRKEKADIISHGMSANSEREKLKTISDRREEIICREQFDSCRYLFSVNDTQFFLFHNLELEGYEYHTVGYLRGKAPKHLVYAGMVGWQLAGWYETHQFCGRCGQELVHDEKERMMKCPICGYMEYPKICPCVIVGVIHEDKILVTKYRDRKTNYYALVAGFAEVGETIEETVHREVMEETGVKVKNLRYYKCQPWPFSESLLFGFFCELDGSDEITMEEDELSVAKWISRDELEVTCNDFALTNEMLAVFKDDKVPD